jgi:hypothetical protein
MRLAVVSDADGHDEAAAARAGRAHYIDNPPIAAPHDADCHVDCRPAFFLLLAPDLEFPAVGSNFKLIANGTMKHREWTRPSLITSHTAPLHVKCKHRLVAVQ